MVDAGENEAAGKGDRETSVGQSEPDGRGCVERLLVAADHCETLRTVDRSARRPISREGVTLVPADRASERHVSAHSGEEVLRAEIAGRGKEGNHQCIGRASLADIGGNVRRIAEQSGRGERRCITFVGYVPVGERSVDHDLRALDASESCRVEVDGVRIGERRMPVRVGEARVEKAARRCRAFDEEHGEEGADRASLR